MRRLRARTGVAAEEIEEVRAHVNPYVLELMGKTDLTMGLEGKFSIYHCAAVGYIDGTARVRQFTDEAVRRPEVVALGIKSIVAGTLATCFTAASVALIL